MNGIFSVPEPYNEPIKDYKPGSPETKEHKAKLAEMSKLDLDIPLIIGGKEVRTKDLGENHAPHDHSLRLGRYHKGGKKEVQGAVKAALKARKDWSSMAFHDRAAVFLRAAELLAGPYRSTLNAATMLCQSKTVYQAEIDSACELLDFWRFNVKYAEQVYARQPRSSKGLWNRAMYRPLEGFVFAVTPFNFTSIAGNLPTAPAIMGNTVIWKPARNTMFSAYFVMQILKEAGLPDGVINMITGPSDTIGDLVMKHPSLAGVHFTGSTPVFQWMWKTIGTNIANYKSYPRIVGETGGKDFIFVHESADVDAAVTAVVRGAFEYQGQKCSAASRAYIPQSMWPSFKAKLEEQVSRIKMGDVKDFRNFMAAVIDKSAYENIKGYIDGVKPRDKAKVIIGGKCDDKKGWFVEPTVIKTTDPHYRTMEEEIFGPVMTIYVYPDKKYVETLRLCDKTSMYALTGAVFALDRKAIAKASEELINSAGNFYINDKPTGAVVGQQPFGGARASGTNDKAGSFLNLLRWVSALTVKENVLPPKEFTYPHMQAK